MQLPLLSTSENKRLEIKLSNGYVNGLALLSLQNENKEASKTLEYLLSYYRGEVLK